MALVALGCSAGNGGAPRERRSVVLVSIDALRADRLPGYGGGPELNAFARLAKQAVVFDDAVSVSPMPRPAAATLLTGQTPDRLQVRDDVSDRLGDDVPTLAAAAREAGSRTGAFVSTPLCSYASGFDRGFELFDGPEETAVGPLAFVPPQRPAAEVAEHAASWMKSLPSSAPFLAWIHLGALHGQAVGVEPDSADAVYGAALREVDAALTRVLDAVAARGGAVDLVVVGTHGAHLGEGGRRGSAFWLSSETLRVPLYWRGSGLAPAHRDVPAWLPDVAVTVSQRAGWKLSSPEGRDLFGEGDTDRIRRAWTWAPEDQLAWPTLAAAKRNGAWIEDAARPAVPRARTLSESARAKLRAAGVSLGAGGGGSTPRADPELPVTLQRLRNAVAADRPVPTARQKRHLRQEHPGNLASLTSTGFLALLAGAPEEAEETAKRLLAEFPDRGEALHVAAHVWYGQRAKAEALLEAAWELGPQEPEILYDLACLRALQDDTQGALARLEQAILRGYRDWRHLEADADLASLRKSPRYAELLRTHAP